MREPLRGLERALVTAVGPGAVLVVIERVLPVPTPVTVPAGVEVGVGDTVIVGAVAGRLDDLVILAVL